MALKCPQCASKEFYLVVEPNYSFKVNAVGLEDVVPGEFYDEVTAKSLVCDECEWSGWINEYHMTKSGVILSVKQDEEDEDEEA